MRKHIHDHVHDHAGFTLTELLAVLAIMAVVGSAVFLGVHEQQKRLQQRQLDDAAKEIFIAAQYQFAIADAQGLIMQKTTFGTPSLDAEDSGLDAYYLKVDGRDPEELNDPGSVISLMLPYGSIDETVRSGGSFLIHYQRAAARILDVYYAEDGDAIVSRLREHTENAQQESPLRLMAARSSETPAGSPVGHYGGVDPVALRAESGLAAPYLQAVNGDTLSVRITDYNAPALSGAAVMLEIAGAESGQERSYALPPAGGALNADGGLVCSAELNADGTRTYTVVLDDLAGGGARFAQCFASGADPAKDLIPGEDLILRAVAYSSQGDGVAESAAVHTNSLFGALKDGTATISSLRHLQNLDPDVSRFSPPAELTAVQTTDLSWESYSEGRDVSFVPVDSDGEHLLRYEGGGHRITGMSISAADAAGLFGTLEGDTVSDLELADFDVLSEHGPAGALGGSLENVAVSRVLVRNGADDAELEIRGKTAAGGLAGSFSGSARLCAAAVYVSAEQAAGGLLGKAVGETEVRDSYSGGHTVGARYTDVTDGRGRVNVTASEAAGGLIGDAGGEKLTVAYSYSSCSASAACAGGLVGRGGTSGSRISDSYATGRVIALGGAKGGPFIGETNGTDYSGNCYYLSNVSENVKAQPNGVKAVDGMSDSAPEAFVLKSGKNNAFPYDDTLMTTYLGLYSFPTLSQLDPALDGSTLPAFASRHYGDWQIPSLERLDYSVTNGDVLLLSVKPKEGASSITFSVTGETSGKTVVFLLDPKTCEVVNEGTVEKEAVKWIGKAGDIGKRLSLLVGRETAKGPIAIPLDDITARNTHFAAIFGDVLTPGEDLTIRLGSGSGALNWSQLKEIGGWTVNSLFADGSQFPSARISCVRHLENLDPLVSNVSEKLKEADVTAAISWDGEKYPYITGYSEKNSLAQGGFFPLHNSALRRLGSVPSKGKSPSLTGFPVKAARSFVEEGAGNAGLFRLVDAPLTVSDLRLADFSVTASGGNAGTVAAEVSGAGALTIRTVLAESSGRTVSGDTSGGLVGRVSSGTLTVTNSAASMRVTAVGPAGGLIGAQSGGTVSVADSYVGGHTVNGKYAVRTLSDHNIASQGGPAGGVIGEIAGGGFSAKQTFSAASVGTAGDQPGGGFIGATSAGAALDTVYVIAPVSGVKVTRTDAESLSGAFIGQIAGPKVTNQRSYYLPEVYPGCEYSGYDASGAPNASYVAYAGAGGAEKLTEPVYLGYYDQAGRANAISAKSHEETMQVYTSPYDASLNSGAAAGSSREYPFSIWTSFSFDRVLDRSLNDRYYFGTFYGDWEPVLKPATVSHTVVFRYADPLSSGKIADIGGSLGTQQLHAGEDNSLLLPYLRSIPGYERTGWYVQRIDSDGEDAPEETMLTESGGMVMIPAGFCSGDRVVVARFQAKVDEYSVSFYYDPTGNNAGFRRIGHPLKLVGEDALLSRVTPPTREIEGYVFSGWYTDPGTWDHRVDFSKDTPVTGNMAVYAKYDKIEYYTVTVDFMYVTEQGTIAQLSGVPRYSMDDAPQYRIRSIAGSSFNEQIELPESLLPFEFVGVTHYEGETEGTAEPVRGAGGAVTALKITANGDAHFMAVYRKTLSEADKYTYTVRYTLLHTRSDGSYDAGKSWTFDAYTADAPRGVVPTIAAEELTGYTPQSVSSMDGDNVIVVTYERNRHTLSFDSRSGSYVAPVLVYYGQSLSTFQPTGSPTRQGYSFSKWSLRRQGDSSVSYAWTDAMPDHNVEAVAEWSPGNATPYTVIFWRQKVTDAAGTANADKTYDFAGIVNRTGRTGDMAGITSADRNLAGSGEYLGFTYNASRSDTSGKTIQPDGSTVLNVYYDRNVHTLTFQVPEYTRKNQKETWISVHSITKLFGQNVGSYFNAGSEPLGTEYAAYSWEDSGSKKVYTYELKSIELMPNADVIFHGKKRTTTETIYYYLESLPGTSSEKTFNGRRYQLYKTILHDFNYLTYNEEYHPIDGFERDKNNANPGFGSNNRANIGSNGINELYYTRNSYTMTFYNALEGTSYSSGSFAPVQIPYQDRISNYLPSAKPTTARAGEGYAWDGRYYSDQACTTEFNFDTETMPSHPIVVYVKFVLPSYTVRFDLNDPAPADHPAQYKAAAEKSYSFTVERNRNLGGEIAETDGSLKAAYTPVKNGWSFLGWYYRDGGTELPFINSMGIQSDMTVYAKWERAGSTEKRTVTVRYLDRDGNPLLDEDGTPAAPDLKLENRTVGERFPVFAEDVTGYYPQLMVQYVTPGADIDNVVTFVYSKIEPWEYTVEYYVRYRGYETLSGGESFPGVTLSDGYVDFLALRETGLKAYNQYETIQFLTPERYQDYYHLDHYEYGTETDGKGTLLTIHPDKGTSSGSRATVKYYLSPDPSALSITDRYATYDGTSQAEERETVYGMRFPESVQGKVENLYRYYRGDKTEITDGSEIVNAGAYSMNGYMILTVTGVPVGETKTETHCFLVCKDTTQTLNLRVGRRSVTITSASETRGYDPLLALSRDDPEQDIRVVGFAPGEGADYSFSVEAFRMDVGTSYNSFTYKLWSETVADSQGNVLRKATFAGNYDITVVFGKLTVTGN